VKSADNGVRLEINGHGSVYLSGPDVDAARDVPVDTPTTTRTVGGATTVSGQGGTKLSTIAQLAHIPPSFVQSMTIPRASAPGSVTISGAEVRDGFAGDPLGLRYATVYTGYGHGVQLFRPLRDGADVNAPDAVTTFNDADLQVALTTTNAALRTVRVHADDRTLRRRTRTGFSAQVDAAPAGVTFTYSWDFGDGTTEQGATPSHSFAPGHYRVTVTAVGDDGSSGVSTPITIQVAARTAATPTPTPTPTPHATPAPTGGGEGNDAQRASGPARSNGTGERQQRGSAHAAPTPAPLPPVGQPEKARQRRPQAKAKGTQRVEGILLASAGVPAAAVAPAVAEQRAPARRGALAGGSPAGWLGGGALLIALLAVGAAREGGFRRRLPLS
jgi:hypothetical protein